MSQLILIPLMAGVVLVAGLGAAPAFSRPGAAPSRVAPSSATSTPVVPRPSSAIAAQNSGNLSPASAGGSRLASPNPALSGGTSTDI